MVTRLTEGVSPRTTCRGIAFNAGELLPCQLHTHLQPVASPFYLLWAPDVHNHRGVAPGSGHGLITALEDCNIRILTVWVE